MNASTGSRGSTAQIRSHAVRILADIRAGIAALLPSSNTAIGHASVAVTGRRDTMHMTSTGLRVGARPEHVLVEKLSSRARHKDARSRREAAH